MSITERMIADGLESDRELEIMGEQTSDTFTCELCGGTFPKAWSDAEAQAEAVTNGFDIQGDTAVVCDDCYDKIMGREMSKP